mmetsp:Transcript_15769/g.19209  ORF Transcript_15769/g.19209 Transcript_15769/m.19209 type:complete len:186 (-) Transcript_15769:331-888(-)
MSGPKNKANFEKSVEELVEALLTEDAYKEQLTYLQETGKPFNMSVQAWIHRMKAINAYLPVMKTGGKSLTETQLIQIITKRQPVSWHDEFKLQDGHKLTRVNAALSKLKIFERREKCKRAVQEKHTENNKRQKRNREEKGGSGFRNKCARCDDDHKWFDCPEYNKNSKAYKEYEKSAKEKRKRNF